MDYTTDGIKFFVLISNKLENVASRIIEVLDSKQIKVQSFCEEMGISKSTLYGAKKSGRAIGTDIVQKFLLKFKKIDAYWLITGEGNRDIIEKNDHKNDDHSNSQVLEAINKLNKSYIEELRDKIDVLKANLEDLRGSVRDKDKIIHDKESIIHLMTVGNSQK